MIWVILLLSVAALGGLIAYAGDTVGRRIGKKHFRLFGLRPKTTGLLIAVLSGVAVALVTVGTVALLARNTLDNAIRAQEIRADLEVAKQQLGVINQEYGTAKRDLEQASAAQKTLQDQLTSNRAELLSKQQELSSAVDLFGRLKIRADELETLNKSSIVKLSQRDATLKEKDATLKARDAILKARDATLKNRDVALKDLEGQRRNLSSKITELGRKRSELETRIQNLTAEKRDFEQRYDQTQTRLLATQARLDKLEGQVRDFEASRSTLEGDINALIQTKANLEKSNQDLQAQNTQLEKELADIDQNLKETRSALSLATQGEFIYRRNELIVQAVLPEGTADQVRSKLSSVMRQASLIVESRGAARGKPLSLLPNDDLEPYVAQAVRSSGPDLVMVRTTRNLTRGVQVPVTLEIRSNKTLYLASQPIRTLEVTLGGSDRANAILTRLQTLLRDVRGDLRAKSVPLENINPPDVIPDDEVAEFAGRLRELSGSVVIGVAGRQDVLPSGPLRFYFFILR
jgi:uncharacterized protein (DUF3084 family)